jgi:CcmD family protein
MRWWKIDTVLTVVAIAMQAQGEFVPARPGELQEKLPATPFVFIAYAFVWGALALYVFLMWRRLARVERDLADVRGKLHRGA